MGKKPVEVRSRKSRRAPAAAAVALAVAGALAVSFAPPAAAAPPSPTEPAPAPAPAGTGEGSASDLAAAMLKARDTKQRVEVLSGQDLAQTRYANPDGTLTDVVSSAPIRARLADGSLVPIDTSLVPVDGRLQAKATNTVTSIRSDVSDLERTLDVARMQVGGGTITMGYASALPTPSVAGAVAKYALADSSQLTVEALDQGFGADIVLTKAPLIAPVYVFPIQTTGGLTPRLKNGSLEFADESGKIQANSRPLQMWDAHRDSGGDPDHIKDLDASLTRVGDLWLLTIKPSLSFLTDSDTVYPVTVDPTITTSSVFDSWYYNGNTTNHKDDYYSWLGTENSGTTKRRIYQRWNNGMIIGKVVVQATLSMYQYWAGDCSPKGLKIYPTTTWSDLDSANVLINNDSAWYQNPSFNKGNGGCSGGTGGYASMDVTKLMSAFSTGEVPEYAMEFRADSETQNAYAKRFCSHNSAPAGVGHCEGTSGVPSLALTYIYDMGVQPKDSLISHRLNDRSTLQVHTSNGDAVVQANDVHLNGRGLDMNVDRFYNSLSSADSQFTSANGQFGPGWVASVGADVHLSRGSNSDRWDYVAPGNTWYGRFVRKTTSGDTDEFWSPRFGGVNAELHDNGDNTFTMTFHDTQEKYVFATLGCSTCDMVLKANKDRNGNTITYNYNTTTRQLTSITDTHGRVVDVNYGTNGYISSIVERTAYTSSPRTWTYHYDALNQLDYYIDPTGKQTDYGYSGGLLTTITDPAQNDGKRPKTILTYSNGQVTAVEYAINATGGTKKFTYAYSTSTNAAQAACNSDKPWTSFTTVTNINDPQGGATKYCIKDWEDNPSPATPNAKNDDAMETRVVDGNGKRRSSGYTPNMDTSSGTAQGNEASAATDGSTVGTYNPNNMLTQVTRPKNTTGNTAGTTSFDYNTSSSVSGADFLPSSTSTTGGSCSSMNYDSRGNLTDTYTGIATTSTSCSGSTSGKRTHVEYNTTDGTPKESWSPVSSGLSTLTPADKTLYTYYGAEPNAGELSKVVRPGGNSSCTTDRTGCTTYVYDGYSRLTSSTDGNGNTTSYSYDKNDRITQVLTGGATSCTYSAGTCITYTFDGEGNMATRIDKSGTTTFGYDWMNRQSSQTQPSGTVLAMTYDGAGNLTQYSQTLSGQVADVVTYGYDAANNLSSVTDATGSYGYTYNDDARPTKITLPTSPAVSLTYAYTKDGKVKSISNTGGTNVPTFSYDYNDGTDETGQLHKTTSGSLTTTYTYDGDDRLKDATPNSGNAYAYTYDANGNLKTNKVGTTTTYYGYNENNQLCWSGTTNGTQMGQSCPSTPSGDTTWTSDKAGNNLGTSAGPLTYNAGNQVTSITHPAGTGGTVSQTYTDQGNNLRLTSGITGFTVGGPVGVTALKSGSSITYYTRDPQGQIINTHGPGAGGTFFYLLDRLGSTVALIDTAGARAGAYAYDPYGKTTVTSGTSTTAAQTNPWRYTGGYQDPVDGYYKFGARYYDSAGHFNQQDPVPGSINRIEKFNSFSYTLGDPLNNTDVAGTNLGGDFGTGFGGLAAGAIAGVTFCAASLGVGCVIAGAFLGATLTATGGYVGTRLGGGSVAEAQGAARNGLITGAFFGAIGGPIGGAVSRVAKGVAAP